MKISNIKVVITEKDILSIITEVFTKYIKMPELKISNILVDKCIIINGSYDTKITVPFSVNISIIDVANNCITFSVDKVNVKKLSIFKSIKNLLLKNIIKQFNDYGIVVNKDIIKIDLNILCEQIPVIKLNLISLNVISHGLEAEVSDFNYFDEKESDESLNPKIVTISKEKEKNCWNNQNNRGNKKYNYSKLREEILKKFPSEYKKIYSYTVLIPDVIALLIRLYKDNRVGKDIKIKISVALAYLTCPLDIFPDFLPIVGKLDDIAIIFFMLQTIFCEAPEEFILENWEGEENIILITKEVVDFLSGIFGANEIKKFYNISKKIFTKGFNFFIK